MLTANEVSWNLTTATRELNPLNPGKIISRLLNPMQSVLLPGVSFAKKLLFEIWIWILQVFTKENLDSAKWKIDFSCCWFYDLLRKCFFHREHREKTLHCWLIDFAFALLARSNKDRFCTTIATVALIDTLIKRLVTADKGNFLNQ